MAEDIEGLSRNAEASALAELALGGSFSVMTPFASLTKTQVLELGFLLELADCMVVSGLARKESRGAHARPSDFPDRDDENYLQHTLVRWQDGRPELAWKPVTVTKWQPMERTY